jgi:putative cell wall-binding protein
VSKIHRGLRRAGIAGAASTLALGGALVVASSASAADPNETAEVGTRAAALPSSHGNSIPPLSYRESGGAQFATGTNTVTLSLSGGDTFTPGVTPQITGLELPSDYTISAPVTTASANYTFTVTAPATVAVGDFVTVSGLKVDTSATPHVTTLTSKNDRGAAADVTDGPFKVLNVLNFDQRFGGETRYGTAAKLFEALPGTQDTAVVASGEAFPDALGANVLASKDNSGLLMTRSGSLPSETKDAIISDNVKKVYLLGGTGAVSAAVEDEIAGLHVGDVPSAAHVEAVRIQGIDRYATNRAINAAATPGAASTVLVASGKDFPDALALGPISYNKDLPLILTNGTALTAGDIAQLNRFNPAHVVIAGGTTAVSTAVETAIEAQGIQASRIGGATRFDTAANIARWATTGLTQTPTDGFLATGLGFSSTAGISLGTGFADALAAGALLGEKSATLLLTQSPTDISLANKTYLNGKDVGSEGISDLLAIGATDVVPSQLMADLASTVEK